MPALALAFTLAIPFILTIQSKHFFIFLLDFI